MDNILRLNEILREKDMSSKELAERMGVHQVYISQLANGHKFPRKDTLLSLAAALDVDVRDLFHSSRTGDHEQALREIRMIADRAIGDGS